MLFMLWLGQSNFCTLPDFSGDWRTLSYEGGALRIGEGLPDDDPAKVGPEETWDGWRLGGVGGG